MKQAGHGKIFQYILLYWSATEPQIDKIRELCVKRVDSKLGNESYISQIIRVKILRILSVS